MRGALAAALLVAACNADAPRGGKNVVAPIAEAPVTDVAEGDLRILDPGAEPRAVRRYAFVAGRAERRVLTVAQTQDGAEPGVSIALTVDLSVRPAATSSHGTVMEMKLVAVHVDDARPEVEQDLAHALGTVGTMEVSPRGEIGELALTPTVVHSQLAADVVTEGMRQLAELAVLRLPAAPIGVGASWETRRESREQGLRSTQTVRYRLTRLDAGGASVTSEVSVELPKTELPHDERRPSLRGGSLAISASGSYAWELRWDGAATNVRGALTSKQTIELDGQAPASQTVTWKQTLTTPN